MYNEAMTNTTKMQPLTNRGFPPSWPTAGIGDARAFRIGESRVVHEPTHGKSNLIRGRCGVVARIVETDGPRAYWANAYVDCPTCLDRKRFG